MIYGNIRGFSRERLPIPNFEDSALWDCDARQGLFLDRKKSELICEPVQKAAARIAADELAILGKARRFRAKKDHSIIAWLFEIWNTPIIAQWKFEDDPMEMHVLWNGRAWVYCGDWCKLEYHLEEKATYRELLIRAKDDKREFAKVKLHRLNENPEGRVLPF